MRRSGSGAVLITGCSSGIGHATAARLARRGGTVYATARRPQTLSSLAAAGCRTLALDVTDEESMRTAVATVEEEAGGVAVLVNNAGYSQGGPLEEVPSAGGPYAAFTATVAETTAHAYGGWMGRVLGAGPDAVAGVIERAITVERPRPRYVVTPSARLLLALHAVLPDRAFDAILARQFPRPGR